MQSTKRPVTAALFFLVAVCCVGTIKADEGEGNLEGGAKQAGNAVGSTMREVGLEFKKIGKAIGQSAKEVGKGIGNAAKEGGRAVKNGIKGEGNQVPPEN